MTTPPIIEGEATVESPFPGPRPFTERESALLFARGAELNEMASALRTKVVVQLTAPSGAGKTSFLYAKLMPVMREANWLPMMYRQWGHIGRRGGARPVEDGATLYREVLRLCVQREIDAGEIPGPAEFGPLDETTVHDDIRIMQDVTASKTGGVVLIFDQFEELYRSDSDVHDQFLQQVVEVARTHGVRQVVSLRKEYADDVRPYLAVLGNMGQSWLRMGEIDDPERLREVITKPPAAFGVTVEPEAVDGILTWLTGAREEQNDVRRGKRPTGWTSDLGASRVGLIHLQALLWNLWRSWKQRAEDGETEPDTITVADVSHFEHSLEGGGSELITTSLRAWIEAAFLGEEDELTGRFRAVEQSPDPELARRLATALSRSSTIRDQAAQMAIHLSAGGYKITQECTQLARQCLGDELAALGVDLTNVGDIVMASLRLFGFESSDVELDYLGRLEAAHTQVSGMVGFSADLEALGRVAGRSYTRYAEALRRPELEAERAKQIEANHGKEPWLDPQLNESARRDAATELFVAFAAAMAQLREKSVIRETPRQEGTLLIEIVHDAFGPVLMAWAEDRIMSGHWAIDAVTAVKGQDLIWSELTDALVPSRQVRGLCWRGCWIAGPTKQRMRLEHLTFDDCDFAGSVFNAVDFVDTTLTNCNLTGVLFQDCTFDGFNLSDGKMAGSTFRNTAARGDGATLRNMFGDNMVLDDVSGAPWTMDYLNLDHCLVKPVAPDGTPDFSLHVIDGRLLHWTFKGRPRHITIEKCTIAYSTADPRVGDAEWLELTETNTVVLCSFPDPVLQGHPESDPNITVAGYPGTDPADAARWLREPTHPLLDQQVTAASATDTPVND